MYLNNYVHVLVTLHVHVLVPRYFLDRIIQPYASDLQPKTDTLWNSNIPNENEPCGVGLGMKYVIIPCTYVCACSN